MIIDSERHPEKNIYFIGAQLIKILRGKKDAKWDITQLFDRYNAVNGIRISFDYHLLGLDWLYVLGLIDVDTNGNVFLCI